MVNEFCGFKHGVIGTNKLPADTTLNNMKKADLIKLLHTAQHNYETLMWFYNNAVKANMSQLNNNGWIPCSERLPEEGTFVLLQDYNENITLEYCKTHGGIKGFDDGDWWSGANNYLAWQPLPPKYEPKGE